MKKHEFAYFEYFHYWCSQATKKILYRPDREAVYMELYGHLEDRFEAYISEGLSTKEAMEKALTSMGEPEPDNYLIEALSPTAFPHSDILDR